MSDHETLPDLLAGHVPVPLDGQRVQCVGCLQGVDAVGAVFATYWGFAAHLADVIDSEFLVVPRSGIEIEYGVAHD